MRSSSFIAAFAILTCFASLALAVETKEARLTRLQNMSAVEKEKLRRNQDRLKSLPEADQLKVRELESRLSQDPEGERLRQVMLRYHEWLRSLPSAERAALLSLVEEERISKIKAMLGEQETERFRDLAKESLTQEDAKEVRAWVAELTNQRKSQLLEQLPPKIREKLDETTDPRRLYGELLKHLHERDGSRPPAVMEVLKVTEEDRQQLVAKLSPKARDVYRQASTEDAKKTVFQNWFFVAFLPPPPSPEEVREFMQRLSPEERDRLENLPPAQMKSELNRRIFFDRRRRYEKDRGGPFPGGPRGRPGEDFMKRTQSKDGSSREPQKRD